MTTPAVSVIVGVLNGESFIHRQLDALGRQQGAPDFEVVVADNGSTDGTLDVVRRWVDERTADPICVRIVDASERSGIAHARNTGVLHARGRLLAFCDADDVVEDGWVRAVAASRLCQEDGAIGGRVMALGDSGLPTDEVVLDSLDGVRTRASVPEEIPCFWGCNFAMSRETYERVGGFDESLPPYGCEDIEIGLRLAAGGHRVSYEPGMTVFYAWPRGRRRKFRRNIRAGTAMACVWSRHPEAFPRTGGLPALVGRAATATVGEITSGSGSWRARGGRAADELATHLGYLVGTVRWVRSGRLGRPRLLETIPRDARDAREAG